MSYWGCLYNIYPFLLCITVACVKALCSQRMGMDFHTPFSWALAQCLVYRKNAIDVYSMSCSENNKHEYASLKKKPQKAEIFVFTNVTTMCLKSSWHTAGTQEIFVEWMDQYYSFINSLDSSYLIGKQRKKFHTIYKGRKSGLVIFPFYRPGVDKLYREPDRKIF